jgi:dipeptidyl aminopeptidase/acylaminoacyl peptidase
MSEDRSKGMYHSLIGKPSLRVGLVMGLLIGLCSLLLLAACGGGNSAKGGADQEHNKSTSGDTASTNLQNGQENKKSTSGGTASTNSANGGAGQEHKEYEWWQTATDGLIAFRRYLDLELTPDGRRHSKFAIFTMYPNGSHIRQITHPPKGFTDDSPAWSPDGTKVAFHRRCSLFHCSENRIMVVDVNTGDTRKVTHCNPHNCFPQDSEPAFSPDGKSIAFRRITGSEDERTIVEGIFILGLDGSNPHQVTNVQKRGALEFEDFTPAFSPDGKRLVFERTRLEDDHTAVFVQPIDSSGQPEDARQITPWNMNCGDGPEFSPNGDWLLFSCVPEGGSSNLYIVHPDGTGLERLTNSPGDVDYVGSSFSPEFKLSDYGWGDIVAARYPAYGDEGNSDVFGMQIDIEHGVQETVNLTKSEPHDDAPGWGTYPPSARQ